MSMQTVGRLSQPVVTGTSDCVTVSGSKGLLQREDLLFEVGAANQTGVDLPGLKNRSDRLGGVRSHFSWQGCQSRKPFVTMFA